MDSRLAVAPPEEASIIGIRRAAPCQTARASPASGGLSLGSCPARRSEHHRHQEGCSLSNCPSIICIRWTLAWQLPRPKKRASSASGGLLLVKLPEHHLHQVVMRLAVAPTKKRASSASTGLLLLHVPSLICINGGGGAPAKRESAFKRTFAWQVLSRPLPAPAGTPPKGASITSIGRPEHHLHQADFRLAGARKRSEHYPHQLGHFFHRCQERSEHHWHQLVCFLHRRRHMHQVNSRLASACPSTEANIIGISRVKLPLTREKRSASASSGPPHALPGAPPKKRASAASAGPRITCIGWTLAWQLPRPKKRASSASGGLLLVKLPEHHLHRVDSRLAVAPPEEASIIGIRRAAPCQTARASPASGGLSLGSCPARRSEHHRHQEGCSLSNCPSIICIRWTLAWQLPRPKKRASSASGGLLLVKLPEQLPEHHLHQVVMRLAVAPTTKRASSASTGLLLLHVPSLICINGGGGAPAKRESAFKRTFAWQVLPAPSPIPQAPPPKEASITSIGRPEHHLHQVDFRLAGARKRSEHYPHQLGHFFHRCQERSEHHWHQLVCFLHRRRHMHQVNSRLASACPSTEANIIGISRVKLPLTREKRSASASSGPPPRPSRCPPKEASINSISRPENHLHRVDSRLAVAPPEEASIIGIRRATPCQTARASSASGGLSFGNCATRRSEHHRHQEGCSLSNCPSIICIRWTLAWQLPRRKKRASSASGGLLLVKLPEHHLHQVDSRLAVAPPEEASIIGIRRAAPCQTARASSASGGLSLGSCPARRSEHHRHQEGCSLSNCPSIICIRFYSRLPGPPPQASEHHRHQEGSSCQTAVDSRFPPPRASEHHRHQLLLLVKLPEQLPEHHLHQMVMRLAGAPTKKRASSDQLGCFFYKCRA